MLLLYRNKREWSWEITTRVLPIESSQSGQISHNYVTAYNRQKFSERNILCLLFTIAVFHLRTDFEQKQWRIHRDTWRLSFASYSGFTHESTVVPFEVNAPAEFYCNMLKQFRKKNTSLALHDVTVSSEKEVTRIGLTYVPRVPSYTRNRLSSKRARRGKSDGGCKAATRR